MSNDQQQPGKKIRRIEDVFILLSILALWPAVLNLQGLAYDLLVYAALGGLIFIFIRRMRRFHAARDEMDSEE
jgi:hypothetical protein